MFGKKKCKVCGNKLDKEYRFCPHCGFELKKGSGLLDEIDENGQLGGFSGFGGMNFNLGGFNKIIGKMAKDLEKSFRENEEIRFREINKEKGKKPQIRTGGLSISISSDGNKPVVKIKNLGNAEMIPLMPGMKMPVKQSAKSTSIKNKKLTEEQERKMGKFPKTEPQTTVRRLSNKIIYEIDIPGIKEKDLIINKFPNSIEIKAFTKDKVYMKIIPVSLPILKHSLEKDKLILELKPEV